MLQLGSKFRNWILGDSERHSLNTETWMCIAVTRVLEAKRQHLLARLHCFQVLHQLACEDFGNFHHSYKGMPLYRASRGLCKDTSHPFCRQICYICKSSVQAALVVLDPWTSKVVPKHHPLSSIRCWLATGVAVLHSSSVSTHMPGS